MITLLAACGPSSSNGGTANQETATSTPSETVERKFDMAVLQSELVEKGGRVGVGDGVTQPFLSVTGQTLFVKQDAVQVFPHAAPAAAQAEAGLVDPTGFTVGTTSISWAAPPHIYLRENLLVPFVGSNGSVIDPL